MFHKMPFILAAVILSVILFGSFLPLTIQETLYAISLSIKTIIVFLLPVIIFGLLFKAAVMLSGRATAMIGMILLLACCSSYFAAFLSHFIGIGIYHLDLSMITPQTSTTLEPLWTFDLPSIIANDKAMLGGIILGIALSKFHYPSANRLAVQLERFIGYFLKFFVYLIPFFVAGFVMKLKYDGVVGILVKDYAVIFLCVALAQFTYILLAYFILSGAKFKAFLQSIKNMLPAGISGFSTMSSAATMPLTLLGVEKNTKYPELARSVVPATVNIHLIGDCFALPIFAYAILKGFGMPEPTLMAYLIFTFYFVLAKFSVAGVPGGGVFVLLPVLQAHLGFSSNMLLMITTIYILFDPVITCANVMGNGAFAKFIDRVLGVYPMHTFI